MNYFDTIVYIKQYLKKTSGDHFKDKKLFRLPCLVQDLNHSLV